jgi:sarcosine oxidase subunit beta
MAERADIVVVGGGVIGASTAFHLAKAGAGRVLLLERRYLGAGASGKSGAVVRMHYSNPYDASLAQQSLPYFQHWGDYVGHGDARFTRHGMARLTMPGEEEPLRANVEMLQECGVKTWLMTPEEFRAEYPMINVEGVPLIAWEDDSGYADPNGAVHGLAAAAEANGAEIRLNTPVIRVVMEGDRVTGVETPDGIVETNTVLLATGAWSNDLLDPLGIDYGLRPNRVQVAIFRRPMAYTEPAHPIFIDSKNKMWIRPDGPTNTLAGYDYDLFGANPDFFNESIDWEFLVECRKRLSDTLPFMKDAPMRGGWAGVLTNSPDGHIVLEQTPGYDGLFLAVGDSGTNFKTAPMIGKCLTEWIMDGAPKSVDITVFAGKRFADNTPIPGGIPYGVGPTSVFH